jgi:predicted nuclease with TOPRIM domain
MSEEVLNPNGEEKENIKSLITRLRRLREENRRLRQIIRSYQEREKILKERLNKLIDKIENLF